MDTVECVAVDGEPTRRMVNSETGEVTDLTHEEAMERLVSALNAQAQPS